MFRNINAVYSAMLEAHGDSAAAVGIPKDNQAIRYESVSKHLDPASKFSILDYGCGLAHFHDFLIERGFSQMLYVGADINQKLLDQTRLRNSGISLTTRDSLFAAAARFDYVAAVGTFNLVYDTPLRQQGFIFAELKALFELTDKALFVNFMHTEVDFEQAGAWHQSVGDLFRFAKTSLSDKVTIDSSYLPYEFTAVIGR